MAEDTALLKYIESTQHSTERIASVLEKQTELLTRMEERFRNHEAAQGAFRLTLSDNISKSLISLDLMRKVLFYTVLFLVTALVGLVGVRMTIPDALSFLS